MGYAPGQPLVWNCSCLDNPTIDLAAAGDRRAQLDDRLQQLALDAGLSGVENLLDA